MFSDPSGSFGYNPDDGLSSESYEQNGNVLATGGKTFTYDSQNELISRMSNSAIAANPANCANSAVPRSTSRLQPSILNSWPHHPSFQGLERNPPNL